MSEKNNYKKLELSLTVEEKELIKLKAKQAKMSMAKFIVTTVENHPIFVIENLTTFAVQLKKLGTNINQLAKIANEQKFLDISTKKAIKEIQKTLEEIAKCVNKILLTVNVYRNSDGCENNMNDVEIENHLQKALMLVKSRKYNGDCENNEEQN
jgi:uncharacterized protein (DUF1778 family)